MLKESGIVVEIDDKFAIIQIRRTRHCSQCAAKGCGIGSLSFVLGQKETRLKVINLRGAKVGDRVVIGLQEQALLKSSLILYLLPLLGLFVGAIGYEIWVTIWEWHHSEILTVLAGLVGFFMGLLWVKRINFFMSKNANHQPVIL
ncbi:MAG: hypothetical protein DRQ49_13160 [Gammaproteobacteria bacterium]|nr:MAG: hypothetical protein DRQ49_13160 [Gammaproteobacteria bacterium]RKZ71686.1 MAG: hypothetical protein DRQ57_18335 [Gammaproteobacteria bacterium]